MVSHGDKNKQNNKFQDRHKQDKGNSHNLL